jgi:anti-sigma factor (TIGR02949 family)
MGLMERGQCANPTEPLESERAQPGPWGWHSDERWTRATVSKLSCQEVLDQLWEYLDDEARAELSERINEHLGSCRDCSVEVDSLRKTISLYRCDETVVVPIQLSASLSDALGKAYREGTNG